jgi:hypothetical protein
MKTWGLAMRLSDRVPRRLGSPEEVGRRKVLPDERRARRTLAVIARLLAFRNYKSLPV